MKVLGDFFAIFSFALTMHIMYEYSLIGVKPDAFSPSAEREAGSELSQQLPRDPDIFVQEFREKLRDKTIRILTEKR